MTEPQQAPKAATTISMRIPIQARDLIDSAAASLGKSRTDFMIDSARQSAIDVLLDRRVFDLGDQASRAFADALAAPPKANAALRALMRTAAPWE